MSDDGPSKFSSIENEAYDWMRRFVSGEARAADLASLQQWCARSPAHREAFERVSRAWQQLAPVGEALRSVRTTAVRSHSSRIARRAVLGGALAASAAGAAALLVHPPLELWPSWSELAADYRTEPGEQRQVTLSDAVSIDLNTRTSINLHPRGGQGAQIELITGEAIISATSETAGLVAVVAADGRIAATHARFNVRYDQDQTVCVTCLEGEVQVERLNTELTLTASRQVAYSSNGIGSAVAIDAAAVTAWQQGVVIFRSTPITEVVATERAGSFSLMWRLGVASSMPASASRISAHPTQRRIESPLCVMKLSTVHDPGWPRYGIDAAGSRLRAAS